MNGRRSELAHNTPEQVHEYVAAALRLVDELEVPADLRAAAFTKAADLYAAKQITVEQIPALGGVLGRPVGN